MSDEQVGSVTGGAVPAGGPEAVRRRGQGRVDLRLGVRRRTDKTGCPACGSLQSEVVQHEMTVLEQMTNGYWRRRSCLGCGAVYPTIEHYGEVEDYLAT